MPTCVPTLYICIECNGPKVCKELLILAGQHQYKMFKVSVPLNNIKTFSLLREADFIQTKCFDLICSCFKRKLFT